MSTLKISLVQCEQFWEDKNANLNLFESLLKNLYDSTDLVLLPEMFNTSFSMNASLAEEWLNSQSLTFLKQHANAGNFAVYTSLMIKEDNKFYNRGVFVFPNVHQVFYDKRKLFTLAEEDKVFTPGSTAKILKYLDWNIHLNICYDLRFPELMRNEWVNGEAVYDLQLIVANWPEKRSHHWKSLLTTRAIENQCYVAAVNRVGRDGNDVSYVGDSIVVSPLGEGEFIQDAKISTFTVSKSNLLQIRSSLPFLKDR
jgi:predicted amidohydrolase